VEDTRRPIAPRPAIAAKPEGMSLAAPQANPECTPAAANRSGYVAAMIAAAAPPAGAIYFMSRTCFAAALFANTRTVVALRGNHDESSGWAGSVN
jgi:hypothetical protein